MEFIRYPSDPAKLLLKKAHPFTLWQRIKMGGVGSPLLWYQSGHRFLDDLQARTTNMLRVNFERTKAGLIIRANERQADYLAFLHYSEIVSLEILPDLQKSEQFICSISSHYDKIIFFGNVPDRRGMERYVQRFFGDSLIQ